MLDLKNRKALTVFIGAIIVLLAPPLASAFPYTIDPGDQSLKYLAQMFGGSVGSVSLGASPAPAIGQLVSKFNGWFLTLSVVIFSYVVITSTVNTAQEGEVFGKKLSSIWEPFKGVFGMLLLLPYPGSSFSIIQTTVMWAIVQGVGAANLIWGVALDYLVQGMSPAAVEVESFSDGGNDSFATFRDAVAPVLLNNINGYDASIYDNVLCVVTANAIGNGSVIVNEKPSSGVNYMVIAQAAVDMGYHVDRIDQINPGGNLNQLTMEEFSNSYPDIVSEYNLGGANDITIQGYVLSGLGAALSRKHPTPLSTLGPRFKAYPVVPRQADGGLVINFSGTGGSSSYTGTVTSYVNYGLDNATGDLAPFANICGQSTIITSVNASEAGVSSAPVEQQKVYIRSKLNIAVDGKSMAVTSAALKMTELIRHIVDDTVTPRDYSNASVSAYRPKGTFADNSQGEPSGYVLSARNAIDGNLSLLLKTEPPNGTQGVAEILRSTGWSTAGMTYFLFAQQGSSTSNYLSTTNTAPTTTPPQASRIFSDLGVYSELDAFNDRQTDLKEYLEFDRSTGVDVASDFQSAYSSSAAASNPFVRAFTASFDGVTSMWANMITGDGSSSPLVKMAKFGQTILLTTEIIWIILTVMIIIMGFLSIGTFYGNPMFGAVMAIINMIYAPIIAICLFLWPIGAMLGIWIPLVPYLMFTSAFLGWLILVIEAVICAQLIGLSIVTPGGEEIGKSKTGLTIILSVILRPTLMVFGFFLASRLFTTFVVYLNFGMGNTLNSIWQLHPMIARLILPLLVYMGVVMAADTQCYRLIHLLPDKILRWMGGPVETDGVKLTEKAREMFDKGSDMSSKAMAKTSEKAQKFSQGKQEEAAKKQSSDAG